jgi:hypothetical protein
VNGYRLQGEGWNAAGSPEIAADSLETEWVEEGWLTLGDGYDFASFLLVQKPINPEVSEALHQCAQIRVFKRGGMLRVLGVLRTQKGQTVSGLSVDIPVEALQSRYTESKNSSVPSPPPEGTSITVIGTDPFHLTFWLFQSPRASVPDLRLWCRAHSLRLKPWSPAAHGDSFIATRFGHTWFLNVESSVQGTTWVWTSLPDRALN